MQSEKSGRITANLKGALLQAIAQADDPEELINEMKGWLHEQSAHKGEPVNNVQWAPIEQVTANDYNPNSVALNEMRLLYTSILHDGYTQPVVTILNAETGKYEIVDGFHRYLTMKANPDIMKRAGGRLPVVVIRKDINDRMASTIRHNRARGKHSIDGMSQIVFSMLENGWEDAEVCNELGMEAEELVRLKHVTGFSKLFSNTKYKKAWETRRQIKLKREWEKANGNHPQ